MKFFRFLKKKITLLDLIFGLVLLFVIFLRFYRFDQTYHWTGDNTRDFLVAEHIVKYHDFKWVAPWAAGSDNSVASSVFYYYFIAMFQFFSFGNVLYYQLLISVVTVLIEIIYSYLFAKLFFKEKIMRYGSVLLFCLIPIVGLYSRSVYQPYLVMPFLMMSFYYFSAAFAKKSIKNLSLAAIFYFVCLNFHYAVLTIFPWFIFLVLYLQYFISLNKNEKFSFKKFFLSQINYPGLIVIIGLLFWFLNQLMIKGSNDGAFSFYEFFYRVLNVNWELYINSFSKSFSVPFKSLIGQEHFDLISIIFYSLSFTIFALFFVEKKTFHSIIFFFIFLFFPSVFLVAKNDYNYYVPDNYFVVFYSAFPFLVISVLHTLNDKLVRNFIFVFFLILSTIFSVKHFQKMKFYSNRGLIEKYKTSALIISNDATLNLKEKDDFFIFVIDDIVNWSSSAYWYYLEKIYKTQLTKNINSSYNITPLRQNSRNFYLICDNPRPFSGEGRDNRCIERIVGKEAVNSYTKIFSRNDKKFSIYRVTLNKDFPDAGIYGLVMSDF